MDAYLKFGAMLLLTVLIVIATLFALPLLFNGAGWVGFFGAPIIGFGVIVVLCLAWSAFLKRTFKLGDKREKTI